VIDAALGGPDESVDGLIESDTELAYYARAARIAVNGEQA
jgi:hypothetical protein